MAEIDIIYASEEGQTKRIAERIAELVHASGHRSRVLDFRQLGGGPPPVSDGLIVGASVHVGHHSEKLESWVREHRDVLDTIPTAFFSVSLSAGSPTPKAKEEAREYVSDFLRRTEWQPNRSEAFGGALRYTRYGFFKRWMMRLIASRSGSRDLDTHRDYEYTDWHAVEQFTNDFLAIVE